jgi:hypothetical protein
MSGEVAAKKQRSNLVAGFPADSDWQLASPISFSADWQGKNADPQRSTDVRLLWSPDELYLCFECRYRELYTFESPDRPDGRKDHLWDRDVAEAFLQPDRFGQKYYSEFEISPNGFWIDLEITPKDELIDLKSGMRSSVRRDAAHKVWIAQLAIPFRAMTKGFDPQKPWRANFFRCEGQDPKRAYLSWRPTMTPEPQFHVPQQFGVLKFEP